MNSLDRETYLGCNGKGMTGVSSLMGFHHLRQLGLDVPEKFKWGGSRNGYDNGQK